HRCMLALTAVMLLHAALLGAAAESDGLRTVAANFYNLHLKLHPFGVPSEQDLAKFRPYLSGSLQGLLRDALRAEQSYADQTGGKVPPLVESDLFTSLFEGATGFKIVSCEARQNAGSCMIEFVRQEPNQKPLRWQDRVYLLREPRAWVIDDVEYLGDWQFMHKGRLKTVLKRVIEEGNKANAEGLRQKK
ncbi:MAG TPA: DUF3828 domain-containing protein, partial [Candidatus Binatia bacterium]|nr:DUF3828 domain-containing protein [Candidatus Binatia bacterium]